MCRSKILLAGASLMLACIAVFALLPADAWASGGPARTVTLAAGPYIVDVNLYQDPPVTDQVVEVTVIPHDGSLRLSGSIFMVPGLGTDAVELHSQLSPMGQSNTLVGTVRMPVRGAWQIMIQLNGQRGTGEASFAVTVAGPGAIPVWLGWLIALTPLLGVAWWLWQQRRYRLRLLAQAHVE